MCSSVCAQSLRLLTSGGSHFRQDGCIRFVKYIATQSVNERNIGYNLLQFKQFSAIHVRRALCLMTVGFFGIPRSAAKDSRSFYRAEFLSPEEQRTTQKAFLSGKDVLASLLTGFSET